MQISLKLLRGINHAKSTVCIKFQLLVTFSTLFTASSSLSVFARSVLYASQKKWHRAILPDIWAERRWNFIVGSKQFTIIGLLIRPFQYQISIFSVGARHSDDYSDHSEKMIKKILSSSSPLVSKNANLYIKCKNRKTKNMAAVTCAQPMFFVRFKNFSMKITFFFKLTEMTPTRNHSKGVYVI